MNSRIIITGASRGIGSSIAQRFYDSGYKLALISSTDKIYKILEDKDNIERFKVDVTNYEELSKVFKHLEKLNDVEGLVNSAGIAINSPLSIHSEAAIKKLIDINLMGTIYTNKLISKLFIKNKVKEGSIINISSIVGIVGNSGQVVYSASKAGVIGLTKSLAKELGPRNIRVNCIAPGFINSDMTNSLNEELKNKYINQIPLSRFGECEEIADAAYFLHQNKYMNGTVLTIDGGLSL